MKVFKYTGIWLFSLLIAIAFNFFVQRKLGWLSPTETLEILVMRIAAWPLLAWMGIATLALTAHSVRADVQNKRQQSEQAVAQQRAEQTQQQQQNDQQAREFAIALVGAQLTTGLFNQTKPVAYYLNPMLERLQPYGKKPKGVFAPANGASYIYEEEPTIERKFVLYLKQLSDKLVWPFRFPALHKDYLYKGLGRMWGEPQQRIPQFITLPKVFEIREPERVAAIERGEWDPAIPVEISRDDNRPLDAHPPLWRWHWRYFSGLFAYLNYENKKPFTEFHYQFAHAGGYDSIKNAFAYIEKNPPAKTDHPMVWTLAVDAPQFVLKETDRNANDSGTLLMWAHPNADTGRKPLVLLQRPVTHIVAENKKLSSADVGSAITEALTNAQVSVGQIGHLVTDFGVAAGSTDYLSSLGEGLKNANTEPNDAHHAIDLIEHRTDLTASLGDIGANTAGFSSLITAWAAFAQNKPSVLISRSAPNRIDVLVFKPRANHVPPSHDKAYYAAVAEPEFSRPWWGERLDGKPDFGDEPGKKRLDGKGLIDPEQPFEFMWQ